MGPSSLCAVFLVYLCQMQGSSAVTPVFVQKGKDVLLNVTTADGVEEDDVVSWNFNKAVILVRFFTGKKPKISPVYTGRIEFLLKNFSVKLMNLQDADSGIYTAQVLGAEEAQVLDGYHVTVQDPVSPVKLRKDSVSTSSDSCNLTVSCSAKDSHINSTFRCDNQTCSQEGGERSEVTASGASLHVYLENKGSIICNHSNQVSQTKDMKMIKHLCPRHAVQQVSPNTRPELAVLIVPFLIIVSVSSVLYLRKRGKSDKTKNIENTIYAVPQAENTDHPQSRVTSPNDNASCLSPTSTYCMVGPHTGPIGSTETKGNTQVPESLYAQVERPARS